MFGSSTLGSSIRRFIFERIRSAIVLSTGLAYALQSWKSGYGFSTFYRETARDVRAKFIVEAANHPTDPEADEVSKLRFAFHRVSTVECFIIRFSIDNYSRNLATWQSYIAWDPLIPTWELHFGIEKVEAWNTVWYVENSSVLYTLVTHFSLFNRADPRKEGSSHLTWHLCELWRSDCQLLWVGSGMSYFALGSTSLGMLTLNGRSVPNCYSQPPSHLILLRRKYFLAILHSQTLLLKLAITFRRPMIKLQDWLTSLYLTNCSHFLKRICNSSSIWRSSRYAHNLPPVYSISSFNHSCSSSNQCDL